jgi:membrane-associated PAP2 superfamily phosphatase
MSLKRLRLTLQLIAIVSLVFWSMPSLDLWASQFFFDDTRGRFVAVYDQNVAAFRETLSTVTLLVLALALIGLVSGRWLRPYAPWPNAKACLFITVVAVIGPYLLVNVLLKDNWGRPRPYQTSEFSGERQFQPVWKTSDQCARNCSFVSGEVAATWALLVPALCLFGRRRMILIQGAVGALTVMIGLARMSVGSHFLSDVILAALLTDLVIWSCYYWLYEKSPGWSDSGRIDRFMGQLGRGIRAQIGVTNTQTPAKPTALGLAMMELIDEGAVRLGYPPPREQAG